MTNPGTRGEAPASPRVPDVVYVVRPGENEELRYSLRSLAANLPHGRVFIVGSVEPWLQNVVAVELPPLNDKFANQRQSLEAAVARPDLSDPFILFNDDHFVITPLETVEILHLGPWPEYRDREMERGTTLANSWWRSVYATAVWMGEQGHPSATSCEAHTPLLFSKARLADVLARYPRDRGFCVGMTYDLTGAGGSGRRGTNVKCETGRDFRMKLGKEPYLSSNDGPWAEGVVATYVKRLFPEPSCYERA